MVAWPKPPHTGVVGLKLWVRSTYSLLWITLSASANDGSFLSLADAAVIAMQRPIAMAEMNMTGVLCFMLSLLGKAGYAFFSTLTTRGSR